MFNINFAKDIVERAISTFAQAWVAAMAIPGPDLVDAVKMGAIAALICVGKAVAATRVGDSESGSLIG